MNYNNYGGRTNPSYGSNNISVGGATIDGFAGTSSPIMDGTWVNPKTGDYFTVRDCYFEDNNYVVKTTDGRTLDYNTIQKYFKTNVPISALEAQKKDIQNGVVEKEEKEPLNLKDIISEGEDEEMNQAVSELLRGARPVSGTRQASIAPSAPQQVVQHTQVAVQQPIMNEVMAQKPELKDADVIERALKRVKAPDIELGLKFEKYPSKQIEMLTDLMGCEFEDIAAWMYEQWFSKDFRSIIINKIVELLESGGEVYTEASAVVEVPSNIKPDEETPKKKQTKKSKK